MAFFICFFEEGTFFKTALISYIVWINCLELGEYPSIFPQIFIHYLLQHFRIVLYEKDLWVADGHSCFRFSSL